MILLVAEKHLKPISITNLCWNILRVNDLRQATVALPARITAITWYVGHLITLAPLDAYPGFEGGWRLSN